MIIGITGVFGSGKSTAAKEFGRLGFKIIDADDIGHKLLNRPDIKNKIMRRFGNNILTNKKIDRKKLKNIVFYDKNKLSALNKLLHAEIVKEIRNRIRKQKSKRIAIDAALIIEFGELDYFDKLIVVKISKENQLKRLLKKGKYNKEIIDNIINSQLPQEEKLKYADYVLDNNAQLAGLRKQVKKIYNKIV